MATPKIIIEKPPAALTPKGVPGLAASSPWTEAQRTVGGRREKAGFGGIGGNWILPPPLPPSVVMQPRQQLANLISGGSAYDQLYGGGNGYTTSGSNQQGQSWGFTPSGVRSSYQNPGGGWGNATSGNYGSGNGGNSNSGFSNGRGGYGSYGPGPW